MIDSEPHKRAYAVALRFLSHRPRSEVEVRTRLRRFPTAVVEQIIGSLKAQSLIDDANFSRTWSDSRDEMRPRSAWAIKQELMTKGIDEDTADKAVQRIDDKDSAYRAGRRHAERMKDIDLATFQRRLWAYLKRRGFGDALSRRTIRRLWEEMGNQRNNESQEEFRCPPKV